MAIYGAQVSGVLVPAEFRPICWFGHNAYIYVLHTILILLLEVIFLSW